MPDDFSPYLYGDEDPEAKARLQGQIAGLRRNGALAQLLALSGDKGLSGFAGMLNQSSQQGEQRLAEAPQMRLRRALEAQQLTKGQADLAKEQADMAEATRSRGLAQDPNSTRSVLRRALAKSFGMQVQPGVSASDIGDKELEYAEKLAQMREMAAARRDAAAKEKAPKPIPETEAMKVNNQIEALKAIGDLEAAHAETNGIAGGIGSILPIGNTAGNRYDDAKNALASAIAAGAAPAARENAQLMEEFKKGFPRASTDAKRAKEYFAKLRDAVRSNARSQISTLAGGGYAPAQVADMQSRWKAADAGPAQAPAGAQGHPQASAALQWAKANPNDPRAAAILQRLGGG